MAFAVKVNIHVPAREGEYSRSGTGCAASRG